MKNPPVVGIKKRGRCGDRSRNSGSSFWTLRGRKDSGERGVAAEGRIRPGHHCHHGEQDGVDYLFLDRARFEQRVEEGGFLEHAEGHGNLYGSPRDGIEQQLVQTRAVLLLIDVQGARKLRQDGVDTLQIFLEPPGLEELRRRIEMRGVENEEMVDLRLRNALSEMEQKDGYDHCVVNEVLDDTIEEVASIIEEELTRRGEN